jgi:hypothetical protein
VRAALLVAFALALWLGLLAMAAVGPIAPRPTPTPYLGEVRNSPVSGCGVFQEWDGDRWVTLVIACPGG